MADCVTLGKSLPFLWNLEVRDPILKMRNKVDLISDIKASVAFSYSLCQALYPHTTSFSQILLISPFYNEETEAQRAYISSLGARIHHLFICALCTKHRKDTTVKRLKVSAFLEQINSHIILGGGKDK